MATMDATDKLAYGSTDGRREVNVAVICWRLRRGNQRQIDNLTNEGAEGSREVHVAAGNDRIQLDTPLPNVITNEGTDGRREAYRQ
nr:unnamed protein product [Spirometra erinaceieuropaei]